MVMLRPSSKAQKIAKAILSGKGVKTPPPKENKSEPLQTPYLQH